MTARPRWPTGTTSESDNRAGSYTYEIVTDFARFLELRDEWDELHAADGANYLGQSHAWTRICWETVVRPKGGRMFCLTERRDGRLVLVWPTAAYRRSAWSILRPLDSQTSEYTTVLVDPTDLAEARVSRAWRFMLRNCGCDLISLPDVRAGSALGRVLAKPGLRRRLYVLPAPWLRTTDFPDWNAYYATISPQHRSKARGRRRSLEKLGDVRFEVVTDPARCIMISDWMISQKRIWMEQRQLQNDWMFSSEYRDFLEQTFLKFASSSNRVIFALAVGGQLVAAELCNVDRSRVEGFMGAYAPGFKNYSLGQITKEYVLQWAFERGLDYDLRVGGEPWKAVFSNRSSTVIVYLQAVTAWGAVYLAAQAARQRVTPHLAPVLRDASNGLAARFSSIGSALSQAKTGPQRPRGAA